MLWWKSALLCIFPMVLPVEVMSFHSIVRTRGRASVAQAAHLSNAPSPRQQRVNVRTRLYSSQDDDILNKNIPHNCAIVGGGLAGLSTAYHLIQAQPAVNITIFDKSPVGKGGASAVAGGFLHPLSPRGKLVYFGMESLTCTNDLIDEACQASDQPIVLQQEMFRLATTAKNAQQLQKTSQDLPHICNWLDRSELLSIKDYGPTFQKEADVLGALRMHSGCKVLHVPYYLKGLWNACRAKCEGSIEWVEDADIGISTSNDWEARLQPFDAVVFSAGAGLFHDNVITSEGAKTNDKFPVSLVRGQSVELQRDLFEGQPDPNIEQPAVLCGKYLSPLPSPGRVMLGATHEFKTELLGKDEVVEELRERSVTFASALWENSSVVSVSSGVRVQSNRGNHGRLPIVGPFETSMHENAWILMGLSSRGLLYHGIYGKTLSQMMLRAPAEIDEKSCLWWKKD